MREAIQLAQMIKDKSPERALQTFYRLAIDNHLTLNDLADVKSNILLSVSALLCSVVITSVLPKMTDPSNHFLILPSVMLVICCIITIALSILVTRPTVTSGTFSQSDLKKGKVNLLFFGNFHKMELEAYEKAVKSKLKDKYDIYNMLTLDLYFLGSVTQRKYKLLRYSYIIFILGPVLAILVALFELSKPVA